MTRLIGIALLALAAAGCGAGVPVPATLGPGNACQSCRMVVVDRHFASQIVSAYEEPRFFDDLGCLSRYLEGQAPLPRGAVVYVADHHTTAWVPAGKALYTRVEGLSAPMGSHFIAHGSSASRDADRDAVGGVPVGLREVFSTGLPGDGR
jgi:copper chaperone NosL